MTKIGDHLETKIVAENPDGSTLEWRLIVGDDEGNSQWVPHQVSPEGDLTIPAWMPLPGSQYLFLQCPIFEAIYEGTRGPGKTLTLIMDFAKDVGKGYGKKWRGVLFRKTFPDLEDVAKKIEEWFPLIFPGFRFLKSKSEYMAVWPTGEALLLRNMERVEDYNKYHGHEYPWIGWEELTQWENDKMYNLMMSCCRGVGVPKRIRSTTNPYGAGHNWVKKYFKLPSHRGKVIRIVGEKPRVAIHGALHENFLLTHDDPEYVNVIRKAASNKAQEAAWLFGSWDVTAGGMFDDLWDPKYHVIPDFPASAIPKSWRMTRAYDHGQSHPFSVGWWLESSGEPITIGNRLIGNVRGDLILWMEWYGTSGKADNEGIRLSAKKIARGILDREEDEGVFGFVQDGPADNEIHSGDSRGTTRSPADDMEDEGLTWERSDKSPGSRVRGWTLIRTYMDGAIPVNGYREERGLFICLRCQYWIDLVPGLVRSDKDLDEIYENAEDHAADMTRYRINWEEPVMWRQGF